MGAGPKEFTRGVHMARMPIRVCRFIGLCGTVVCLWLAVATPSLAGPCTEQSEAPGIFVPDRGLLLTLGLAIQYQHFDVLGTSFHNNGYNAGFRHAFIRYGHRRCRACDRRGRGYGCVRIWRQHRRKSLFEREIALPQGHSPHIAIENESRFEPWIHGLVGWERLRFTQTATLGANSALGYMVGGGLDIRLTQKIYWRFQADYLGTNFQSSLQSNYSTGSGVILYF